MGNAPKLVLGKYPPTSGYDTDIIILTHNRLQETIEAVDSARCQLASTFHITILDQGSNPSLETQFTEAFENHKNLSYFTTPKNLGVGGGRNFLTSLGSGRFIVALDNDATFATSLIVSQTVKSFEENPNLGAIGFKILGQDGIHLDEFSWGYPGRLKSRCNEKFPATTFVGAGHAIRRTTWIAAGGYDADLFFTWEEYDFCLRAIALNWQIICDGSLAVIHKISPEARVKWSAERTKFSLRNRLIIARKWKRPWLTLLPRIAVTLIKALRNGTLQPALAGIIAALKASRSTLKTPMSAAMQTYIHENETNQRENPYQYFRRQILVKTPREL